MKLIPDLQLKHGMNKSERERDESSGKYTEISTQKTRKVQKVQKTHKK